jgi:hypothetical protein
MHVEGLGLEVHSPDTQHISLKARPVTPPLATHRINPSTRERDARVFDDRNETLGKE